MDILRTFYIPNGQNFSEKIYQYIKEKIYQYIKEKIYS